MVSRGHNLQDVLHDYPIDLVWSLYRAALENQDNQLKAEILGFSVALMNALDAGFNSGKGKILANYLDKSHQESFRTEQRTVISPRAFSFFQKLPKKENINGK